MSKPTFEIDARITAMHTTATNFMPDRDGIAITAHSFGGGQSDFEFVVNAEDADMLRIGTRLTFAITVVDEDEPG